jgi:naphthoate synthase
MRYFDVNQFNVTLQLDFCQTVSASRFFVPLTGNKVLSFSRIMSSDPSMIASMSAARDPSPIAPPTSDRDGFSLIPKTPIVWDVDWTHQMTDITYHHSTRDFAARIAFNRPEKLHAFLPTTIREIQHALQHASDHPDVAVIVLTSHCDATQYTPAFCAGGDQTVRHDDGGYQDGTETGGPKLRVLALQTQLRQCPKPVVAVVQGYCMGGGHILHMVADLTLAADNAVFGQTGPRMGSFDAGYGCSQAVHILGEKRAKELWLLCRYYSAPEAYRMGLINAYCPLEELDGLTAQWVRRMVMNSGTALAACKAAINAVTEHGLQQMGGELTRLFYLTKESQEGRDAFLEKRPPQFRSKL